ncbi:M50 family metallopeptidase [Hyalangium versicolor]|uniref:M50 family metallopeptidase n=1 Tax=Hyalangium versicolor TaxID=2861190 RepID=UPI001CD02942|nr:M50 family metallopeptidase [Hyalangium versicolor]
MVLRFRVAGFPVQVHPLFLLMTLVTGTTGWSSPARIAVWFCVVFVSVLVHELGHALMFRRYGHAASISLHGLGGTARSEGGGHLTHRQELWIALAGPLAGFLLGGLVLALDRTLHIGQAGSLARSAVWGLLWANFGWGVFNLLPVLPLDGGHVMAAVIRERGGRRYEWLVHAISLGTAACGLVLSIIWKETWLGMFALVLGVINVNGFMKAWVERKYTLRIRSASQRARPTQQDGEQASAQVEQFLAGLRQSPSAPPPEPRAAPPPEPRPEKPPVSRAPRPERRTPLNRHFLQEEDFPELPPDPQFVGELLLSNGLPELAIQPLRATFNEAPTPHTGHVLVAALLQSQRYEDLTRLLSSPSQQHLGNETLALIASHADASNQPALASRARELREGRARSEPLPARGPHDSEKPG